MVNTGNTASTSTGFQRSFLIFSNEDGGYEAGQKPSGHVRLEVRDGRGKLHAVVQNLRPGNGRFHYGLYLLKTGRDGIAAAYAGQLAPQPNKTELEWSFDPRNVDGTGIAVGEFDTVAVLVEQEGYPGDLVICPLAAYRGRKTDWRNTMRYALIKKKTQIMQEQMQKKQAEQLQVPKTGMQTSRPVMQMPQPVMQIPQQEMQMSQELMSQETMPLQETQLPQSEQFLQGIMSQQEAQLPQELMSQEMMPQQEMQLPQSEQFLQGIMPQEMMPQQEMQMSQQEIHIPQQEQFLQGAMPQQETQMPQELTSQETMPQEEASVLSRTQRQNVQYQPTAEQVDTGCVYLNGNICGAFVNNGVGVNPCAGCRAHDGRQHYIEPPAGNIILLREELDRYFEKCDPFHSNRSDYIWWRVGNPVNLNNLLYQCNIRSPLLFNPSVMMAHYKYRHLIVGIFTQKAREKQYVVCGVPGMSMVDKKPFGDMSRWVQAEGNRPRYGAFGYWLVFIDPDGGKILNMNQE